MQPTRLLLCAWLLMGLMTAACSPAASTPPAPTSAPVATTAAAAAGPTATTAGAAAATTGIAAAATGPTATTAGAAAATTGIAAAATGPTATTAGAAAATTGTAAAATGSAAATAGATAAGGAAAAVPTAATAAAPTGAPAATGADTATHLIVSYSELTPINMALWIADDQGYFTKHGLNVDSRYLESSLGVSALLANEEQFASMGGSETLAAVAAGADLEVLASFSPVYPYKLEVKSSINSAQDLKGRKLGVSRFGSSSDSASRAALRELGLADTDVTFVQVGSLADRTAALLNGNLDGAVDGLPDTLILEEHGFHSLVDLAAESLPAVNNVLVARKSWVDAHHAVTQAYVDAIVEGIARAKADKPLSLQLMSKYLQDRAGDDTQASAAYDYDIGEVIKLPPVIRADQFQDALTLVKSSNPNVTDFDLNSIIDDSFVENAAARGVGTKRSLRN